MNFCTNCGTKVESDWVTCPKCSVTLGIVSQEHQSLQNLKKMCINCGREIQEGWEKCPYCNNRIKFTTNKKKPIIPGFPNWLSAILVIIFVGLWIWITVIL